MSKGGGSYRPPPPPPPPQQSSADMLAEMMPFFQAMMQQNQAFMSRMAAMRPAPPQLPEIEMPEPIDFEQEQETLETRVRGQNAVENARKYGRTDTLHAPLLLDDPDTTQDSTSGLLIDQ